MPATAADAGVAGQAASRPGSAPAEPGPLRVPLTVRGPSDRAFPPLPLWTGVPLPRGAVSDAKALRLLDETGQPVPAQFDVQARWADGSVKWVLVSFVAGSSPAGAGSRPRRAFSGDGAATQPGEGGRRPTSGPSSGPTSGPTSASAPSGFRRRTFSGEDGSAAPPGDSGAASARPRQFVLTADPAAASPAPPQPAAVRVDTNAWDLTTGPLLLRLNRHAFRGFSQAALDVNADGRFDGDETIIQDAAGSGIIAVDRSGKTYTSALGRVSAIELERAGPMHAVVAVRGDLRAEDSDQPLLNYVMRVHAFAGSSLVRVVLTVHNPRPAGRGEDGGRWGLGESGSVLLKSLQFRQAIRLPEGHRRVSLSAEPGKLLDRIPLAGPMSVYQDSSGGENWFHRAHVNRDNAIPLQFRGYRLCYQDRAIESGLRASPWLDVSDMRWGVSAAAPLFWQQFPKALGVEADGAIRIGLWPGESLDLHELQGGEQKTHEFWLYFRHRLGERRNAMPLDRDVMPFCLQRPLVLAGSQACAAAQALDPILPALAGRFDRYELLMAAAVRGQRNLLLDREQADEYGWRNFGDTPANNERDQTQGPYSGLIACSHYNNEYDLGLGMLTQALRTAEADWALAHAWHELGMQALWHEADIDIYHTRQDLAPIYQGGTFTHTAHGVDAGLSNHRASPRDDMYGRLTWEWGRGGGTESGHVRNRGIFTAWLLGGDRHLMEAAREVTDLIAYKVGQDKFAQIEIPDRCSGNNLQVLLDDYLLFGRQEHLDLCEKIVANLAVDKVRQREGEQALRTVNWSTALYVKSLGRFIDALAQKGVRHEAAIAQHLEYARLLRRPYDRGRGREGTWSLLTCEVMMQAAALCDDPAEKDKFVAAARAAFHAVDAYAGPTGASGYWNSKSLTMLLQGGGAYMRHAVATGLDDAAVSTMPAGGATQPASGPASPTRPASP